MTSRSILHLYRRLIALRHRMPALSLGDFELLDLAEGLLGYRRTREADEWVVVINFTDRSIDVVDRRRRGTDRAASSRLSSDGDGRRPGLRRPASGRRPGGRPPTLTRTAGRYSQVSRQ